MSMTKHSLRKGSETIRFSDPAVEGGPSTPATPAAPPVRPHAHCHNSNSNRRVASRDRAERNPIPTQHGRNLISCPQGAPAFDDAHCYIRRRTLGRANGDPVSTTAAAGAGFH